LQLRIRPAHFLYLTICSVAAFAAPALSQPQVDKRHAGQPPSQGGKPSEPVAGTAIDATDSDSPLGFFLDGGASARTSTRRGRSSVGTFRALPYLGGGHGDSFSLDTVDGGWLKLGKVNNFGFGPALSLDRYVTSPKRGEPKITDIFGSGKVGAFINYQDGAMEWGRLTVTSGTAFLGSADGVDIRATKRFSLSDTLSVNFGPTLTFSDTRLPNIAPVAVSSGRVAATGASLQIEKEVRKNLTATVTANYALVHNTPTLQTPSGTINLPVGRNRFDIGLTLSTRLFGQ
jgi:hypothetical protein